MVKKDWVKKIEKGDYDKILVHLKEFGPIGQCKKSWERGTWRLCVFM